MARKKVVIMESEVEETQAESVYMHELPLSCALLFESFLGDEAALAAFHDHCEEKGELMLPLVVGQKYLVQTHLWYFIGKVKALYPAGALFEGGGAQLHNLPDLPTALSKGEFVQGSEITPIPMEFGLQALSVEAWFDWRFDIPKQKSHSS